MSLIYFVLIGVCELYFLHTLSIIEKVINYQFSDFYSNSTYFVGSGKGETGFLAQSGMSNQGWLKKPGFWVTFILL